MGNKKTSMFELEDLRTNLALKKNYLEFKKTYRQNGTVNKNTGKFWDDKFYKNEKFDNQDLMTKEKIDYIISSIPKTKIKILDIGIGQGYVEQRLKQKMINHNLYGIDISPISIKRARRNFDGIFEIGDILKNNKLYKKNYYDAIVALEVIEHIPPNKIFNFYEKVNKSLKKNGIFIISTPLNEGLRYKTDNPSEHLREYSIPILEAEFKLANFKDVKLQTFYAFSRFYIIKSLFAKFKNRWKPNNVVVVAWKK